MNQSDMMLYEADAKIIECIMCKLKILASFQQNHFRYQHLIQDDWLIKHISDLKPPDRARKKSTLNGQIQPESSEEAVAVKPRPARVARAAAEPSAVHQEPSSSADQPTTTHISKITLCRGQSEEGNSIMQIKHAQPQKAMAPLKLKIKAQNGVMVSEIGVDGSPQTSSEVSTDSSSEVESNAESTKSSQSGVTRRKRGRPPTTKSSANRVNGGAGPATRGQTKESPGVDTTNQLDKDVDPISTSQPPVRESANCTTLNIKLKSNASKGLSNSNDSKMVWIKTEMVKKENKDENPKEMETEVAQSCSQVATDSDNLLKYRCSSRSIESYQESTAQEHACPSDGPKSGETRMRMAAVRLDNDLAYRNAEDKSYVIRQFDWSRLPWSPTDASLPEDWQTTRYTDNLGTSATIFLSPAKEIFTDRERIAQYLTASGKKIASTDGYRYNNSKGEAEVTSNYAYHSSDKNKTRKKVGLEFKNSGIEKIKNLKPMNSNQTSFCADWLVWDKPEVRYERPIILNIEEPSQVQASTSQSLSGKAPSVADNVAEAAKPTTDAAIEKKRKRDADPPASSSQVDTADTASGKRLRGDTGSLPGGATPGADSSTTSSQAKETAVPKKETRKRQKSTDKRQALHVKCCNPQCQIWRKTKQYRDASQVPEFWICPMNTDPDNNECGVGGEDHSAPENVEIKYNRGDLVWGKLKGYPWWPGMIDLSPESGEFYWMDENISDTEPARYNVIFFEKDNELSSAWIQIDNMKKDENKNMTSNIVLKPAMKEGLRQACLMVESARKMPAEERLVRFSYTKVGEGDEEDGSDNDDEDEEEEQRRQFAMPKTSELNRPSVIKQNFRVKKKTATTSPSTAAVRGKQVRNNATRAAPKLMEPPIRPKSQPVIAVKSAPPPPSPAHVPEAVCMMRKEDIKPEHMFSNSNPAWEKVYSHPSLPQDVLITLAVINLDPRNQSGVACKKIIAFLSLHFPYYNRNLEDCRKLVRMAHNIKPEEETGNESFRIKNQLMPRLMERMETYVNKSRDFVRSTLLFGSLLEHLMRPVETEVNKDRPPNNLRMMLNLAVINLYPPFSADQAQLFLGFMFPSFADQKERAFLVEEMSRELRMHPKLSEVTGDRDEKFYLLESQSYCELLWQVRNFFTKPNNMEALKRSICRIEYISLLIPGLASGDEQPGASLPPVNNQTESV